MLGNCHILTYNSGHYRWSPGFSSSSSSSSSSSRLSLSPGFSSSSSSRWSSSSSSRPSLSFVIRPCRLSSSFAFVVRHLSSSFVICPRPRRSSSVIRPVVRSPRRPQFATTTLCPEQLSQATSLFKEEGRCWHFEWAGSVRNWAHIPQERGGAPCVVNAHVWVEVEEVGSVWWWRMREFEATSTVITVDVEFKLRSRPPSSCSISTYSSAIKDITR